jgi:hypothetical protein
MRRELRQHVLFRRGQTLPDPPQHLCGILRFRVHEEVSGDLQLLCRAELLPERW